MRQRIILLMVIAGLALSCVSGVAAEGLYTAEGSVGYREVQTDDNALRAREYDSLESSPTVDFNFVRAASHKYEVIEGDFLNDDDFRFGVQYNRSSLIRLELSAERFFHNLDHLPYDAALEESPSPAMPQPNDGSPATQVRALYFDDNPNADYGRRIDRYEAEFRGKLRSFPGHIDLHYWRLEKRGAHQGRFVKEQCTSCHLQSRTVEDDMVTDEITASVDAHLGPIDVELEHLYRQFNNREATPVDPFGSHSRGRVEGDYQHDEVPDSKLQQTSVRLHTSIDGGLVIGGSYSFGTRENDSDLQRPEVGPVESETDIQKASGDVTWSLNEHWTANLRYRMLDLDNDSTNHLYTSGLGEDKNPLDVRDNIDLDRDIYGAMLSFRPTRNFTVKAEFEREDLQRSDTGGSIPFESGAVPVVIDPVWELPSDEQNDSYRLSFYSRFGNGAVKLNGFYQYLDSDSPAYGTSLETGHRAFLALAMQQAGYIGGNVSFEGRWEENDQHQIVEPGETPLVFDLDREHNQQHLTIGFWFSPNEAVHMGFNYALLASETEQDLVFGNSGADGYAIVDREVQYEQLVDSYNASLSIRLLDNLKVDLNGYYIRSDAEFNPGFLVDYSPEGIFNADSSGLADISRVDIRQTGVQAGLKWEMVEDLTFSFAYNYDDYSDRQGDVFDGTAQTYTANLAYVW